MSMGKRIRERREALKISQRELAQALGKTGQYISAVEQDKRSPSLNFLTNLADELGTTLDYLVSGKEGGISDTLVSIKADTSLPLEVKKALIALVKTYRKVAKSG